MRLCRDDAARYVNDDIAFERSIFRENAIFKMLPSLRRSRRYLQLDAQLRVVAELVVPDTQTETHTHTHTHTQTKYRNPRACAPRVKYWPRPAPGAGRGQYLFARRPPHNYLRVINVNGEGLGPRLGFSPLLDMASRLFQKCAKKTRVP